MRNITNTTIAILLLAVSIQAYHIHQELHQHLVSINESLDKINTECDRLEQDSERQRQEIERMREESSRGGGRRVMEISYYTTAADECGKDDGITASGKVATVGRTIAAGPGIPFGTKVWVNGHMYVVEDRGGAISNDRLDILVEDKATAYAKGRHMAQVVIER